MEVNPDIEKFRPMNNGTIIRIGIWPYPTLKTLRLLTFSDR